MAATASQIHTGLSTALATVPGLRVADHIPEQIAPPLAVIQLQSVQYHRAMAGGDAQFEFVVALVAGRMGERSAQLQLDGWISFSGSTSVRAALEADKTLGGKVQSLVVGEMVAIRPVSLGDASYLSCEFNLVVHA